MNVFKIYLFSNTHILNANDALNSAQYESVQ